MKIVKDLRHFINEDTFQPGYVFEDDGNEYFIPFELIQDKLCLTPSKNIVYELVCTANPGMNMKMEVTHEAANDLKASHGIDIDNEIVSSLKSEAIAKGVDPEFFKVFRDGVELK